MATLEVREQYYLIIFYSRNRSPRKKTIVFPKSAVTKAQVLEIKRDLEIRYKLGEYDPWNHKVDITYHNDVHTIRQAAHSYIEYKSTRDWGNTTFQPNRNTINLFVNHVGDIKLEELSASHINDFINRPGLAYDSKAGYMKVIKAFLSWLVRYKYIYADQIDRKDIRVYARANSRATIKYISQQEQLQLAQGIYRKVRSDIRAGHQSYKKNSLWLIEFMKWQRFSGMRLSETLNMKVCDIDPSTWQLSLKQTKAGRAQYLPLKEVKPLLHIARRRMRGKGPNDYLFEHRNKYYVIKQFRTYRNLFLPDRTDITIHTFRHTCAIDLLKAGVDIYRVMRWLRHSDVRTTLNYADMLGIDVSKEVGRVFK